MTRTVSINTEIVKRLGLLKKNGHLAHAYLFVGPADIGKGETALAVAKLLNCEAQEGQWFCDACSHCMKISAGSHPDVIVIDSGYGVSIKIDQIRDMIGRSRLRPYLADSKVFIIRNIENLTLEAANAFLKTLEEPGDDSYIMLTTSVPEKNLQTIMSRCQAVRFAPLSSGVLARRLEEDSGLDTEGAHFLAYFAQGCPGAAQKLYELKFLGRKNNLIDGFILRRPDGAMIKDVLQGKERTKEFLDILLSWIRDAFLVKAGLRGRRLVHADRAVDVDRFQENYTYEELNAMNRSVVSMCQLLAEGLNIKLPLMIIGEQLWEG